MSHTVTGDNAALPSRMAPADIEALILDNRPLVGAIVRDYMVSLPSHIDRDDLLQAGMVALVTAAQAFDPSKSVPFGRYAAIRIRGAVIDELRWLDWATRSVRTRARELEEVRNKFTAKARRAPTVAELCDITGLSAAAIARIDTDTHTGTVLHFDQKVTDPTVDRAPTPEQSAVNRDMLVRLRAAINALPERWQTVIVGAYFQERLGADLALELGCTESRVSQIRIEALARLRAVFERDDLIAA